MTLPSIVPTGYAGDASDFAKAKADRSGALRVQPFNVSIPSTTASTTIVGLIPVKKGFRLGLGGTKIEVDDLDTSTNVTMSIGIVYNDATNNTNNQTLWVASATTPQAGGVFTLINTYTASNYAATDDGWLVATVGGGATTTTGTVHGQAAFVYDNFSF